MSNELESQDEDQHRSNSRCALLFSYSCLGQRRPSSWWERVRSTSSTPPSSAHRWWSRGLRAIKKIREWSEIVAGPRWKTFIRRFNRNRLNRRLPKYQYDPMSYALNFDDNADFNDDAALRNFSTRYAAANVKSLSPKAPDTELVPII